MQTTEGQQECDLRRFRAVMALHGPISSRYSDTTRSLVS